MSYLDDIRQNDYLHWEDPQSVTLTIKRTSEEVSIDTDYAFRADATKARQAFGGIVLENTEIPWIIPVAVLNGETIEPGDTIEELDGTVWTINRRMLARMDSQYLTTAVQNVE